MYTYFPWYVASVVTPFFDSRVNLRQLIPVFILGIFIVILTKFFEKSWLTPKYKDILINN
jgi:hypothetical protein